MNELSWPWLVGWLVRCLATPAILCRGREGGRKRVEWMDEAGEGKGRNGGYCYRWVQ